MTTVLASQVRRMLVFVLLHEEYCASLGYCTCNENVHRAPGHDVSRVPDAVTLPALATVDANNAVLSVAAVQSAIRRGDVIATSKPDLKSEDGEPSLGEPPSILQSGGELAPNESTNAESPEPSPTPMTEFAEVVLQTKPSPRPRSKRGRA